VLADRWGRCGRLRLLLNRRLGTRNRGWARPGLALRGTANHLGDMGGGVLGLGVRARVLAAVSLE